jgi:hypothetical protein
MYAIKADVGDPRAESFVFRDQKTKYGGKRIAEGDTIFVFASENEGGSGLVATGVVISAEATPKKLGVERQTPRVSITVQPTAHAKRRLGRSELHFKFHRQATDKIVGISDKAAGFLRGSF